MLDFDPNNQTKPGTKIPTYATFIPSRYKQQFKLHYKKNHATAAINYRASSYRAGQPGILYELQDGQWVEIDRYEAPTVCGHCGGSFNYIQKSDRWGDRTMTSCHSLYKHPAKPSYKKPKVCKNCYETVFHGADAIPQEWCGQVNPIV